MAEGFISDEDVEKVRNATDIVSLFSEIVPVQQRGGGYWCVCPFHSDKNPSLKIDPSRQVFTCFGCHTSGDVFTFIKLIDGVDFPDAVRKLADRAHIELSNKGGKPGVSSNYKVRLKEVCKATAEFYHQQLMRLNTPIANQARQYMSGRSLGGQVPKSWNLGFAPGREALVHHLTSKGFTGQEMIDADVALKSDDGRLHDRFYNRIMFPIYDLQGQCIAFGGRVIGKGEPKYLNSKETAIFKKSHEMFGFDKAKNAIAATGTAVIMEGYTDVILSHEAGFTNAVATLGTALTINHIRSLSRFAKQRIVYLFDGDAAGQKAIERALLFIDDYMTPEAGRLKVELCAVTLPDDLDPADYISQYGVEEFRKRVDEAKPLLQFGIERALSMHDLNTAEGRSAAFTAALQILAPIKTSILAKDYAYQLAGRLRIREEIALDELRHVTPKQGAAGSLADSATGAVAVAPKAADGLPDYSDSRLGFEREFLSAAAFNTPQAYAYLAYFSCIDWRHPIHKVLASAMEDALTQNPSISCASLVAACGKVCEQASAVLLGGKMVDAAQADNLMRYLSEELMIGDFEESIAKNRSKLTGLQQAGQGDSAQADELFNAITGAQKQLVAMKKAHKPL